MEAEAEAEAEAAITNVIASKWRFRSCRNYRSTRCAESLVMVVHVPGTCTGVAHVIGRVGKADQGYLSLANARKQTPMHKVTGIIC